MRIRKLLLILAAGIFVYAAVAALLSWGLSLSVRGDLTTEVGRTKIIAKAWLATTWPLTVWPEIDHLHQFVAQGVEFMAAGEIFLKEVQSMNPLNTVTGSDQATRLQNRWFALRRAGEETLTVIPGKTSIFGKLLPQSLFELPGWYGQGRTHVDAVEELVLNAPQILGYDQPKHYIILFQNNMELRPTGGFMGSYGEVFVNKGRLENIKIQDIYVPDGQIQGYVKEPVPIKKYLFDNNHPGWRLRDANWHPDFPESVKAINWFFEEGGVVKADGYIAIDLKVIVDILRYLPVYLPDYQMTVTADNFYQEAQRQAEENFFPGSTQKGDFLRSVGNNLLIALGENPALWQKMLPHFLNHLEEKHLSVYLPYELNRTWHQLGWDGSLRTQAEAAGVVSDYLSINEANVGSTKSNCCIDRRLTDEVTVSSDVVIHVLTMHFKNNNPPKPVPPDHWGGGYKNYLRIITSQTAVLNSVLINDEKVPVSKIDTEVLEGGKRSFGFLVLTEGGQESTVKVNYELPINQTDSKFDAYSLLFQKQAGVEMWPVEFKLLKTEQVIKKELRKDEILKFRLE